MKGRERACKLGTQPYVVVVDGRCTVAVGAWIRVREAVPGSKWFRVYVTQVNTDGYFFADR